MRVNMIAAATLCLSALLPGAAGAQSPRQAWFDPALPTAQRVDALAGQTTLEEKASQMVNQARAVPRLGIPAYDWWSEALHGVANNGYATVSVKNVGARYGDAVPQLCLSIPDALGMPVRSLRGFSRLSSAAGQSGKVHFDLSSSVTPHGDRVAANGPYTISIGEGQPGTGAVVTRGGFIVDGTVTLPE